MNHYDKQIRNLLIGFLLGLAVLIGFFIWDIRLHLEVKVSLPEEWKAISHDAHNPTPLNAYIDSSGIVQTEFN